MSPPTAILAEDEKVLRDELRQRLQKSIDTEAFEEAAKIRDQIKELERKPQDQTGDTPA